VVAWGWVVASAAWVVGVVGAGWVQGVGWGYLVVAGAHVGVGGVRVAGARLELLVVVAWRV
jgi:hypothetical protein